jgi:hypothetical protein
MEGTEYPGTFRRVEFGAHPGQYTVNERIAASLAILVMLP